MKPKETFLGKPIRSLQTMLRVLAESVEEYKALIPDGIYGPDTMEAVRIFQKRHQLPITGVTDQETWDRIAHEYGKALVEVTPPPALAVLLNPCQTITYGERNPAVYLAQVILLIMADKYNCLEAPEITGMLDLATRDAISAFQQISGLPPTGNLDRHTWKHLALHFPLASIFS